MLLKIRCIRCRKGAGFLSGMKVKKLTCRQCMDMYLVQAQPPNEDGKIEVEWSLIYRKIPVTNAELELLGRTSSLTGPVDPVTVASLKAGTGTSP